jgi:predicted transcriptional regulator
MQDEDSKESHKISFDSQLEDDANKKPACYKAQIWSGKKSCLQKSQNTNMTIMFEQGKGIHSLSHSLDLQIKITKQQQKKQWGFKQFQLLGKKTSFHYIILL